MNETAKPLSQKLQALIQSVDTLMVKDIPEIRWIVPGLIPEGLTILAGKAKMGKSLLILAIALAIAAGKLVLGATKVEQGRVLFITPDDPAENRLKARIRALRGADETTLPLFNYALTWPLITGEGLTMLREYLEYHGGSVRLIVIDVLQKVMPAIQEDAGAYARIYGMLSPLKELAQEYHIAIVVVMHKNKSGGADPLDGIYGNTAYGAVADTILLLDGKSGDRQRTLSTYGKDVSEETFPLDYDGKTGAYTFTDGSKKAELVEKSQSIEIGDIVKARPGISGTELAKQLDINPNTLYQRVKRAREDGVCVENVGKQGYYPCGQGITAPSDTDRRNYPLSA